MVLTKWYLMIYLGNISELNRTINCTIKNYLKIQKKWIKMNYVLILLMKKRKKKMRVHTKKSLTDVASLFVTEKKVRT